jgi:hypothetical protein
MSVSTVRRIASLSVILLATSIVASANAASISTMASPTYTVTDLGSNYTLQQGSSGTVQSVTSDDGSQTYDFEKSPVSKTFTLLGGSTVANDQFNEIQTISSGNIKFTSWIMDQDGPAMYTVLGPNGWGQGENDIIDINRSGYTVGGDVRDYGAAYVTYPGNLHVVYDLNVMISNAPGVLLASATKIDDLGDIIAYGTLNGADQYFLLTPNGPPTPTPAPEPSTLAILAVGITVFGVRSVRRRKRERGQNI